MAQEIDLLIVERQEESEIENLIKTSVVGYSKEQLDSHLVQVESKLEWPMLKEDPELKEEIEIRIKEIKTASAVNIFNWPIEDQGRYWELIEERKEIGKIIETASKIIEEERRAREFK